MWISPGWEAAGPPGSRGANKETAPFGSLVSRCSAIRDKAGRGSGCSAPRRRHRVARPAATAPCGLIRAGSPGRRVPADARRGWRALGTAQRPPGACAEPRRQEARIALGRRPRQRCSRRARDARGAPPLRAEGYAHQRPPGTDSDPAAAAAAERDQTARDAS